MAPKRQKKAVIKTTRKVVKETVEVVVVEEESEIGLVENPPMRVVEVFVEEKKSGVESVTVVKSPIREQNVGEGKGEERGSREGDKVEQSNKVAEEQSKTEKGKEEKEKKNREVPTNVEVEQSKEAELEEEQSIEGLDKRVESAREVQDIQTQTPDEVGAQGEEASQEGIKNQSLAEKRKTTDEPETETEHMQTEDAREPETPKKVDVKPKKSERTPEKKNKKRRKKRNSIPSRGDIGMGGVGGYKTYLYRVLKQVHPTLGMSSRGMDVVDMMMADMFERLADEASKLSKYTGKQTITSREVHDAVRLVLPGQLGKHAISEGTKAVSKYMEEKS